MDTNIWNKGLNKNALCKHVNWKILIWVGSIRQKLCSNGEGCFMLILIPNRVRAHTYSDRDLLFGVKLTWLCMCAPCQCGKFLPLFSGKTWTWWGQRTTICCRYNFLAGNFKRAQNSWMTCWLKAFVGLFTAQCNFFCGCSKEIRQVRACQNVAILNKAWCMCTHVMIGLFDFVPIQWIQ